GAASLVLAATITSAATAASAMIDSETYQPPATVVAESSRAMAIIRQRQNTTTTTSPDAAAAKPMTEAQIKASYKPSHYATGMANNEVPAGIIPVSELPDDTTLGDVALKAKELNPDLDTKDFIKGAKVVNPGLIPGKDALSQPIAKKDGEVLVLAGLSTPSVEEIAKDLEPIKKAAVPNPEVFGNPENSIQSLAKAILINPNITFNDDSGDGRVKKSIEDLAQYGKTFLYDLDHESQHNIEVSPRLLQLWLYLASAKDLKIEISSLTTGKHAKDSSHYTGLGGDVSPQNLKRDAEGRILTEDPENIAKFQVLYATIYAVKDIFALDESIYKHVPDGTSLLKHGQPVNANYYGEDTMDAHGNHIHNSTSERSPLITNDEYDPTQPFSVNFDITQPSGLTANQINAYLAKYAPAMTGLGEQFVEIEQTYHVNAWFAIRHACDESTCGTSQVARAHHNLFGRNAYDNREMATALTTNNYAGSVMEYGRFLNYYYLTVPHGQPVESEKLPGWSHLDFPGMYYGGNTTISGIFVHYSTAGQREAVSIAKMMNQYWAEISSLPK
ncbi:MAG: glucosaminidase domain-containing protein, partial [Candidatus Saccharimonadales bacterium]